MKRYFLVIAIFCAGAVSSCKERSAIAPDLGFLQINPRTVEVLIPFDDFVDEIQVFGGYGAPADLRRGFIALDRDGLNARTLAHVAPYPTSADVPGTLSFTDGRIVLVFDTVRGDIDNPVDVEVFEMLEDWNAPSVTWELVVDTAGDQRAWSQPGGGLTTLLGGATFDVLLGQEEDPEAALTDSVSIPLDSATVAFLGDRTSRTGGLLVTATNPGVLLHLVDVRFMLTTTASNVPDTVFEVNSGLFDLTFIFDPAPTAPAGWLRVGGAPSWRSVLTMSIPRTVIGTPEVCGAVGCEVDLTEVDLNLAELVLTSLQTEPSFQPQDTMAIDIRPVLSLELLPKSPLGGPLLPFPAIFAPELFSTQAGTQVSLSLTTLVTGVLGIAAVTDTVPVTSIALFSTPEPNMIGFASFLGAGGAGAPVLRLLYTVANDVGLP